MRIALVSASNAAHYDLLLGLIHSFAALPDRPDAELCILDVGLEPGQRTSIAQHVNRIVPAQWDFDFPDRDKTPPWQKAVLARPYLPRYFPGYDLLIWIDADAWICNSDALRLLVHAAQISTMAIVPELDRAYSHCFQGRPGVTESIQEGYRMGWSDQTASYFANRTIINGGVWAMRTQSPGWGIWADTIRQGLQRSMFFLVEQCALNIAIYTHAIKAHFLPSTCNWICAHALPILDPRARTLHSPMLPHEPISICHLNNVKRGLVDLHCTDGSVRRTALTYDAIRIANIPLPRLAANISTVA